MERVKHKWIGWGYDTTICEHCRVDVYHPFTCQTEYCDEYEAEKLAWEEGKRLKPIKIDAALNKVRGVLTKEEYQLLELGRFSPYRDVDIIKV